MASNDWESLMNGVFGNGGRVRLDKPQKNTAEASPKPTHATVADMQQTLTKQLEQQAQEIAQLGNELTQSMQSDGLLPSAKSAAPTTTAGQPNFEGLPAVLRQQVLGQDDLEKRIISSSFLNCQDAASKSTIAPTRIQKQQHYADGFQYNKRSSSCASFLTVRFYIAGHTVRKLKESDTGSKSVCTSIEIPNPCQYACQTEIDLARHIIRHSFFPPPFPYTFFSRNRANLSFFLEFFY